MLPDPPPSAQRPRSGQSTTPEDHRRTHPVDNPAQTHHDFDGVLPRPESSLTKSVTHP